MPGVISAIILNYYFYYFENSSKPLDVSKFCGLRDAFQNNRITVEELKKFAYGVYKCSDDDSSVGKLYRQVVDQKVDELVDTLKNSSYDSNMYITEVFNKCYFHVMTSLRDTDKQLLVEMK